MRFTKIEQSFWSDRTARIIAKTGPQGFQTYLYLKTGPMSNYIGMYYLNVAQAALDLATPEHEIADYVSKFEAAGLMKFDATHEILWIVSAAEEHIGELKEKDLKVPMAQKEFNSVPKQCALRWEFYAQYQAALKLQAEIKLAAEVKAPVDVAPVSESSQTDETILRFEGTVELLVMRRESNRQAFCANGDEFVALDARSLMKEHGYKAATQMVLDALVNNDLELHHAMGRIDGKFRLDDSDSRDS
jgi:hypothetical protein